MITAVRSRLCFIRIVGRSVTRGRRAADISM